MKTILVFAIFSLSWILFMSASDSCSFSQKSSDDGLKRLVIIKGKATIVNFPDIGVVPATSETLIFQKVGCNSCYIATNVDINGNYKVTVGDGKYKIIVRNPSSPEFDMLTTDQERIIDTETMNVKQVFDFNIKIRLPK